jgi:hypothetical protein
MRLICMKLISYNTNERKSSNKDEISVVSWIQIYPFV